MSQKVAVCLATSRASNPIPAQLRGQMGVSDAILATWRRKILAGMWRWGAGLQPAIGARWATSRWRDRWRLVARRG